LADGLESRTQDVAATGSSKAATLATKKGTRGGSFHATYSLWPGLARLASATACVAVRGLVTYAASLVAGGSSGSWKLLKK
jgi:hypothetical protein